MILASSHPPDIDIPRLTLDDCFRRAAIQNPHALALCDPPNRAGIDGGIPRRLTYIEVDNAITAIAARLRSLGLNADAVITYQLANTVESALLPLGIVRAGMIAAPLPMLWRQREIAAALPRLGATMLISAARIGNTDHLSIAMQAAAEYFPVRHVGAFGTDIPDGVIPLDGIYTDIASPPPLTRAGHAADHIALVTLDTGPDGLFAVARSHAQVLTPGRGENIGPVLTAIPLSSYAGFALGLVPWLNGAAPLMLHHPFNDEVLAAQLRENRCATVILPSPAIDPLMQAGMLARDNGVERIVALWRSPEAWRKAARCYGPQLADNIAFGELALTYAHRDGSGQPMPLDLSSQGDLAFSRSAAGTLAVRGPGVPQVAFPPGAERGVFAYLGVDAKGFADTGIPCGRGDRLELSAMPGIVQCGGYRYRLTDLEAPLFDADPHSTIAALPHGLLGQRLAGSAQEAGAVAALASALNPLIGEAFALRRRAV
jgi:hypothetical protein